MAIDPSTGNEYVCWLSGTNNDIIIENAGTGQKVQFSDWSSSTPSIAVFDNQIFVAWRAGGNNVNIATYGLF